LQRRYWRHGYEEQTAGNGRGQVLTGKLSSAFIVRRIVLGCLSRGEGTRGGIRCAMSRGEREREGGREGGRREREGEGGEGRGGKRVVGGETSEGFRGMERVYDLQRVERHETLPSRFQHVIFLADGRPKEGFPLNTLRLFRCPLTYVVLKRVLLPGFACLFRTYSASFSHRTSKLPFPATRDLLPTYFLVVDLGR
jgi:hypothetical protein